VQQSVWTDSDAVMVLNGGAELSDPRGGGKVEFASI
jgi:hypothetical protein